jgi:NhaP-type Na+/H+ or K+/H+ antiporter
MIDRSELLRTTKAILILAVVSVCITAVAVGVSKWSKDDGPRIIIQTPH